MPLLKGSKPILEDQNDGGWLWQTVKKSLCEEQQGMMEKGYKDLHHPETIPSSSPSASVQN